MKYINTYYSLFDTCDFSWYNDSSGRYFAYGDGKMTLPAETTKLYVSFEINPNEGGCWPLQIYFSDGEYNKIIDSTVQIHYNYGSSYIIELCTHDTKRLSRYIAPKTWHKVYLVIDTVAGTIDFYLDNDKVGTYTGYVKTGVNAISAKIRSYKANYGDYESNRCKLRNFIISDQYFPINESIVEVPTTVTNTGFTYDSSKNQYSTETENSTLQVTPDLSVLDGYKVTGCNVGMGTTILGDTIKNIQCDMGSYSKTKEIPATERGMYFEGLPTKLSKITITAKK